jgi:transposase
MKMRCHQRYFHARDFKLQCCRQVATGQKRPAQICREHNLSESVLLRWRREYESRGESAFTEKQLSQTEALERKVAELERFCGKLALENEILKRGSPEIPLAKRHAMIEEAAMEHPEMALSDLCELSLR